MKGYIYKITSPSEKIYVGQTINLESRLRIYKNLACKNQLRLYRSLVKYGWEAHKFEILECVEILDNILNELEIKWISHFDSFLKGLNCTLGGEGNSSRPITKETREKMRNSQLGKKQSTEQIAKRVAKLTGKKRNDKFKERLKEAHTGKVLSEETKEKIRKVNMGKKLSEETKQKISQSNMGRVCSEETKRKIGLANSNKKQK